MLPGGIGPGLIRGLMNTAPDLLSELLVAGRLLEADVVSIFGDRAILSLGRNLRVEVQLQAELREGQKVQVQVQPRDRSAQPGAARQPLVLKLVQSGNGEPLTVVRQVLGQVQQPEQGALGQAPSQATSQPASQAPAPGQAAPAPAPAQQAQAPDQAAQVPAQTPQVPAPPAQTAETQPQAPPAQPGAPLQGEAATHANPEQSALLNDWAGREAAARAPTQAQTPAQAPGQTAQAPGQTAQAPGQTAQAPARAAQTAETQPQAPPAQPGAPLQGEAATHVNPEQSASLNDRGGREVAAQTPAQTPAQAQAPTQAQTPAQTPAQAQAPTQAQTPAQAQAPTPAQAPTQAQTQAPAPQPAQPGLPQLAWLPITLPQGGQAWAQIHVQEEPGRKARKPDGSPYHQVRIWWETPALGPVQVNLDAFGTNLTALFTVLEPESRADVEAALPRLEQQLQAAGYPDTRLGARQSLPGESVGPVRPDEPGRLNRRL